jgi:signal transduction histidine kinase
LNQHHQQDRFFIAFSVVMGGSVAMFMLFVGTLGWRSWAANRQSTLPSPPVCATDPDPQLSLSADRRKDAGPVEAAARANERERIARDIHDELGAHLMAIKIDLKCSAKTAAGSRREVDNHWPVMLERVDAAMCAVARIASHLRPSVVEYLGLWPAIEDYVREFEEVTKLSCYLKIDVKSRPLKGEVADEIFRIVQESLTNVARHAEAAQVEVKISDASGALEIEINDDGKGISPDQILSPRAVGLHGMIERSKQFGGELHIDGRPQHGTRVHLRVPLPPRH